MPSPCFTCNFKMSQSTVTWKHSENCFCRFHPDGDYVSWYDLVDFVVCGNIGLHSRHNFTGSSSVEVKLIGSKLFEEWFGVEQLASFRNHTFCLKVWISLVRWARSWKHPGSLIVIAVMTCPNHFMEREFPYFMPKTVARLIMLTLL